MGDKASRRTFLSHGAIAQSGVPGAMRGQDAASPPAGDGSSGPSSEGPGLRLSRRAMACRFEIVLPGKPSPQAVQSAVDALDLVGQLEEQLSVFRSTSRLSELNRRAASEPVPVDGDLFELLQQALALSKATEGAFDITSTPLWRLWGFAQGKGRVPGEEELAEAVGLVGSHLVELDAARRTVRFLRPGVELNLGAIGKGYALDRCAERLVAAGVDRFLLSGGYSSMLAKGGRCPGNSRGVPGDGWTVGLRHPLRPELRVAEIDLQDEALGTSAASFQFIRQQGRRLGHVLDPRTGRPSERVLSATVVAPGAALADALSTAFAVMGLEACREFCRAHPHVSAVLVLPGAGARRVQLHLVNFPCERLRILDAGLFTLAGDR